MSIQALGPFLNWVACLLLLGWKSSLYILDFRPLSEIGFADISSHPTGSLFTFLIISFDAQAIVLTYFIQTLFFNLYFPNC